MLYDKDFTKKYNLFKKDLREGFDSYEGFEALEVAKQLYVKKYLNNEDFLKVAEWGITRALDEGRKITELQYIHAIGYHHYKLGNYKEAHLYYAQGAYISEAINNPEFITRFRVRIGEISFLQVNYEKALDYYFKVMRIDDVRYCYETYSNLARLYTQKNDFNTAIDYADKAYSYNLSQDNFKDLIDNLLVIGGINFAKKKYGQALSFYSKAIKIHYLHPNPYLYAQVIESSGDVLYELGHFKEARATYEYSQEICEEYGFKFLQISSTQKIARTYSEESDHDTAIDIIEDALDYSKVFKFDLLELTSMRDRILFHERKGEFKQANELRKQTEALNIAIVEKEQKEKLQEVIEEKEKELEFYRTQARSMASAGDDLKQYAKIIAHDLKEPLRTIGSFATLLQRKYSESEKTEETNEYFDFIMSATHRMSGLLDELLRYVVLGIKQKPPTTVKLDEVVQEVLKELAPKIKARNAIVTLPKKPELPSMLGQRQELKELFYQLIDNAIRHNPSEQPTVEISYKRDKMDFLFSVKDNGPGIHQDYAKKIFLLFHKLDNKDNEGLGVGLAISKKIVELHGGSIWANSAPGKGTSMEFILNDL